MTHLRETLKQANCKYIGYARGYHFLQDLDTGNFERWQANKGFAGYAITYKNTDLEFCSTITRTVLNQELPQVSA